MKTGKAAGIDGIVMEHIKHSHPIVFVILTTMFNLIILSGYVPNDVGVGVTTPIPKSETRGTCLSVNDFRGITVSPVLSKLFEHCLLVRFNKYLFSSCYQFGFKKGMSCSHAIFLVRNTVDHFVKHDSTVNICALDVSKAFDKINISGLLTKLLSRNIPVSFINLLKSWYNKIYTCVRWQGYISGFKALTAGVRQGDVLSSTLRYICKTMF